MRERLNVGLLLVVAALAASSAVPAQVRAIYDTGAGALMRQLLRLQTTASVMHTGAHPDDEDSALVAWHARGLHARTAYLSLTRGSGGQNIIGPERSDLLGVIRTEELLQARRLDGAEQLFTSAVDFGFSKHRSEAARQWDEEVILGDMVAAIRRFRPAVVVSRWNGTVTDGHGHHQYAGYLTPLAVEAAADPARYPAQLDEGLEPWRVAKVYVAERNEAPGQLVIDTGRYDPVTGRSYFQVGMQGRSQQKTQQMGSLELKGRQLSRLRLVDSRVPTPEAESSVFDGLDTSIAGIIEYEARPDPGLAPLLAELGGIADDSLADYRPLEPEALVPTLERGLATAKEARRLAHSADARRLLDEKAREFEAALVLAAGLSVDALADDETLLPGGDIGVAVRVYDPARASVRVDDIRLLAPADWVVTDAPAELASETAYRRRDNPTQQVGFGVRAPRDADLSQPYWMTRPRRGFRYDWSAAGEAQNLPFARQPLSALVSLSIGDSTVEVEREVEYRYADRVRGEIRRRIDVVPAVSVEPSASAVIVPLSATGEARTLRLTVRNNGDSPIEGNARFAAPEDWKVTPSSSVFSLPPKPASTTLTFEAALPKPVDPGQYRLDAIVTVDGVDYDRRMREIAYPHIRTHRVYEPASMSFNVIDVDVAPVRVGYVMGSGDEVPEALRLLGIDVELLDDATLTAGDLSFYDTIVIGIRASQTRPAYVANNGRLTDFAAAGGTLIVQYQQPDFIDRGLAPYPASMDGNVRVVDETAPVVIVEPDHAVFNFPNRIGPADFDGWVQERNNYNFTSFDRQRYMPLLESHDPGEPESVGGMLYASIGDGHYIYSSYSWFRQLPAGVPGAYRLFANMLSLPAAYENPAQ